MATCLQSGQEFIRDAFSPTVGVLVSEDAERIAEKNDLSFVELMRPFCQLTDEVRIRDPVNPSTIIPIKKWKIRMIDLHAEAPPQQLVNRLLNEIVAKSLDGAVGLESILKSKDALNSSTPWFEAYRQAFFQLLKPTDHEFIRHLLACMVIVSSNHSDPMSAFTTLSSAQSKMQQSGNLPNPYVRWFSTNTFKYFVLLHDVASGDNAKAEAIYQSMASVYGSHACYLLCINSKSSEGTPLTPPETIPDPWESYFFPFTEETFDIDETEDVPDAEPVSQISEVNADENEEQILNELEHAEKLAEELQSSPVMTFQDPLTSMHYDKTLVDISQVVDDLGPLTPEPTTFTSNNSVRNNIHNRSSKSSMYKKSLQQFTFCNASHVSSGQTAKPRGQCLLEKDHASMVSFVHEFVTRGLLPHIEKLMRTISEQILSRKGIHRSLIFATKKWFGGNKGAGGKLAAGLGAGLSYPIDSPELNQRKLGDLAFLVQHYELAYSSYHTAKREFNNDHAWAYFAGALEMAAISSFMYGSHKNYPVHYFEACISTYLNTCRMYDYATRSCLMSTEALKSRKMYADAAFEFIKLTSEESDLRSALLLEQAAHCYLHNSPPMSRKFAFHMILAGHRFSKAVQRKHTLRCNATALRVYHNKGWHLAEDHVNFIAGRQSLNLGYLKDAAQAFKELLYENRQQSNHQQLHLKEYLTISGKRNEVTAADDCSPASDLPLPCIDSQATRLLLSAPDIDASAAAGVASPGVGVSDATRARTINAGMHVFRTRHTPAFVKRWAEFEREAVECIKGPLLYTWKPYMPCLNAVTNNSERPLCVCGEMTIVELLLCNPLMVPIQLRDICLVWEFTSADGHVTSNQATKDKDGSDRCIQTEVIADVIIKGQERKPVCLRLTPRQAGALNIVGVMYTLEMPESTEGSLSDDGSRIDGSRISGSNTPSIGIHGQKTLRIEGPRLNATKQERAGVFYGNDMRLQPRIVPEMPLLQVSMVNFPITVLCGEVQTALFVFKNIGKKPLKNLHVACNLYQFFLVVKNSPMNDSTSEAVDDDVGSIQLSDDAKPKISTRIDLPNGQLLPGDELSVNICIRGLPSPGVHELDFLFYYEPLEPSSGLTYRILQQMVRLQTLSTLTVAASVSPCLAVMRDVKSIGDTSASDGEQELILTLKIENRAQGSSVPRCVEFDIHSVVTVSPHWKLRHLYNRSDESFLLRPGECSFLHFAIVKQVSTGRKRMISKQTFSSVKCEDSSRAALDFLLRSEYFDPTEMAFSEGIGVVLKWQTSYIDDACVRHSIWGQTHDVVSGIIGQMSRVLQLVSIASDGMPPDGLVDVPRGDKSSQRSEDVEYFVVNAHLRHPHAMACNFAKQGVCYFEVNVILHNSHDSPTTVQLSAKGITLHRSDRLLMDPEREELSSVVARAAAGIGGEEDHTEVQRCAVWTGTTKLTCHLEAHSTRAVPFRGVILKPGVYDTNCFEAVMTDRRGGVRWLFTGPSLVTVHNVE